MRFNRGGTLHVPWGYVAALNNDPTEKKPFYHVLPGSRTLTFGMLGCDFHCPYCQNWLTTQTLRDPESIAELEPIEAEQIAALAVRLGSQAIASSYNEPLITIEWAVEVFRHAKARSLVTLFVSNGNATPEALDYLRPHLDGYKVDLKSMSDRSYRKLGGVLQHVLDTIREAHKRGFWVEVVTLVVPGFNDSPEELRDAARFLAGVSPDIPWHVTAFHPDYKMRDRDWTPPQTVLTAATLGREEGLRYVYVGNLPGAIPEFENTYCPSCHALLVERTGFRVGRNHVTPEGRCPRCHITIPGIWRQAAVPARPAAT